MTKGEVYVGLFQDDTIPELSAALERFDYSTKGTPPLVSEKAGPCTAVVRAISPPTDAGLAPEQRAGLASLTVRGAAFPSEGLTLLPINTLSNPVVLAKKAWSGGELLTFEAVGGAVPGFAGKEVRTPSDVQLSAPALGVDGELGLDRTADLAVSWTGGGVGTVAMVITSRDTNSQQRAYISCEFPAKDGTGSIPAKLLARIEKAGDPGVTGSYLINAGSTVGFVSGEWDVTLNLQGTPTSGSLRVSK